MRGQLHLTPSGPAPCSAERGKCHYEASGHFADAASAESAFAESMGGLFPAPSTRAMELSSNLGTVEVMDGDLSDPRARAALSSGLCGDLALAIHRQTGGAPYFLSYHFSSDEELADAFAKNPNAVIAGSCHVLIESPTKPNHFVDSYGQQDFESLEDVYGDAVLLEGTPEMLEHFADAEGSARLTRFARSAIELDRVGVHYSQDLDELDLDEDEEYSEEEDGEFSETESAAEVELQLAFGSVAVAAGDLSDPKTRFYFANGLCGDLAMAIQERHGGRPFFAVDGSLSSEELDRAAEEGRLGDHVHHALIESSHRPGYFIDGYGVKSRSEIEEFYGAQIREVGLKHLRAFGSGPGGQRGNHELSAFADTVAGFDRDGVSYSYFEYGD